MATMPSKEEESTGEVAFASSSSSSPRKNGKQDLLMRFFESDFFDAWIAVTYLHKTLADAVHEYLCSRLYTLPENDVERYLSQLCQLCVSRPHTPLETVLVELCAQSLHVAVKTYWLLLAISQDNPRNTHVAGLRDRCEQAGLEGHWDLPFKDARLPAPVFSNGVLSRYHKRPATNNTSQPTTPLLDRSSAFAMSNGGGGRNVTSPMAVSSSPFSGGGGGDGVLPQDMFNIQGVSPDVLPLLSQWRSGALSPDVPSRPLSPDGLGNGLFSSVFMDTGVEGLIYESNHRDMGGGDAQSDDQSASVPNSTAGDLTPQKSGELAPGMFSGVAEREVSGTGSQPGSARRWQRSLDPSNAGRALRGGSCDLDDADDVPPPLPHSPGRRRETTFGATLDFVEALCTASSNLTVFQPEDRQWALQKALHSINIEMDRASTVGVGIWWPMGRSLRQRVVRLAHKESRLLNSREKAPFTLFVEVLNEAVAEAEVEAAAAAATVAARQRASLLESQLSKLPPLQQEMEFDPAAAAALAEGIPWVSHHHRRSSSVDTTTSTALAAAAMTAVQGSSAATATAAAARGLPPNTPFVPLEMPSTSSITTTTTPLWQTREGNAAAAEGGTSEAMTHHNNNNHHLLNTFASTSTTTTTTTAGGGGAAAGEPALSLVSQCSNASTFATDLSVADFASEASHSPTAAPRRPLSSSSSFQVEDAGMNTSTEPQFPPSQQQLPPLPRGLIQGGGHWIGGSNVRLLPPHPQPAASALDFTSGLSQALAALRGEAPLVSVRIHVVEEVDAAAGAASIERERERERERDISRTDSGTGSVSSGVTDSPSTSSEQAAAAAVLHVPPVAAAAPTAGKKGPRSAVHPEISAPAAAAAASGDTVTCLKNGWLCKLGLCKTCNAASKVPSQPPTTPLSAKAALVQEIEEDASPVVVVESVPVAVPIAVPQKVPRVKVIFTVQGGLDLAIKRTQSRHQRMPSHEVLLHVAREHHLPVPAPFVHLPPTPEAPSPGDSSPVATATAGEVSGTSSTSPSSMASPGDEKAMATTTTAPSSTGGGGVQKSTKSTVHGEKWSILKARLRGASPHGNRPGWDVRCVIVKSGDDCRQELLAMQLISTFHEIFSEAQLPLWMRPYEVLVTSNRTALIEMVPNALSIHAIKAKRPPGASLRDHFAAEFGGQDTPLFKRAQRNFVESMAAYSLVCYLLQIKDRHNGNIMLDDSGHVIHIDFGFMLTNSPGGVNFESAPFKLTRELLEVMDSDPEGRPSELFDYYKVLLIQGFLAVRRHSDRITLLVDMMSSSGCPCFKNKAAAVDGVKRRLALGLAEPVAVEVVLGLISDSLDAWRTRQYDVYQRVLNGIL